MAHAFFKDYSFKRLLPPSDIKMEMNKQSLSKKYKYVMLSKRRKEIVDRDTDK
jgi:hypothetical protein